MASSSASTSSSTPSPAASPTLQWSAIGTIKGNPGNPGTPGAPGQRGSQWIFGQGNFVASNYPNAMAGDVYVDTNTGNYGPLAAGSA